MNDLFYKNENINLIIKNFIDKKLRGFEEIKYAYAVMNKKNPTDITIITNKDDWFEHYTKNKYQLSDPVLITATNRIIPFSWDENIMINSGLRLPKIFIHLYEFFLILTVKERKINVKSRQNELTVKGMFYNGKLTCYIIIYS